MDASHERICPATGARRPLLGAALLAGGLLAGAGLYLTRPTCGTTGAARASAPEVPLPTQHQACLAGPPRAASAQPVLLGGLRLGNVYLGGGCFPVDARAPLSGVAAQSRELARLDPRIFQAALAVHPDGRLAVSGDRWTHAPVGAWLHRSWLRPLSAFAVDSYGQFGSHRPFIRFVDSGGLREEVAHLQVQGSVQRELLALFPRLSLLTGTREEEERRGVLDAPPSSAAFDGQGAALFALAGGGRNGIFRVSSVAPTRVEKIVGLRGLVRGVQVPAFDRAGVYALHPVQQVLVRYPLTGPEGAATFFAAQGFFPWSALVIDRDRVLVRGGGVLHDRRAVTLYIDRSRRTAQVTDAPFDALSADGSEVYYRAGGSVRAYPVAALR